jgi:tetratricopeptide (TPR) repeat protein
MDFRVKLVRNDNTNPGFEGALMTAQTSRLERLLGFLKNDPGNLNLLADAASAAVDARNFDAADDLLKRHAAIAPLPPALVNLEGVVALAQQRYADAGEIFASLRAGGADDPVLRFNLAWTRAMTGAYQEAFALLDDAALDISPRAPSLKIHAMHHLDMLDEALAEGERLTQRYPQDQALAGALATLAMDAEKVDLALAYAKRAPDDPEGQAALGMLTLGSFDAAQSLKLFDAALTRAPNNPRAWVGRGLGLVASGDAKTGAEALDKGAALFGDHLGSWIAAGWAHFTNGDYAKARTSFERAMAIDDTFAEAHGGLAVINIMDGRIADAERQADIALRLDKKCLGGTLAKTLLLQRSGQAEMAQRVRDLAMKMPIGPGGMTIAQAMVGFGSGARKH